MIKNRVKMHAYIHTHTHTLIYIFITASESATKTVRGEEYGDLIESSRNGASKQGLSCTSGIETQNESERSEQQVDFGEGVQDPGSDEMNALSTSPQKQEDGITSNGLQETKTLPVPPSSGSKNVAKGGGHTSRFFASLFGVGEKAVSSAVTSDVQNSKQVRFDEVWQ